MKTNKAPHYPGGHVELTVVGGNWTTFRAHGFVYRTLDGVWRIRLNIYGTLSATTGTFSCEVRGITFRRMATGFGQTMALDVQESGVTLRSKRECCARTASSTISIGGDGVFNRIQISGDVELETKPDWII